jgi:hypothetical protein
MARLLLSCLLLAGLARAAEPLANKKLPARVKAPDGKLTLFADFDDVRDGTVTLYLVNRTDEKVVLDTQDGVLYVKLQARAKDSGAWERAEGHIFSW